MTRQVIRGLMLFGLVAATVASSGRAQPGKDKLPDPPDRVDYRDRKEGKVKPAPPGLFRVSPAGFQVVGGAKLDQVLATIENPDDIVAVNIGELVGADRTAVQVAASKEVEPKKDLKAALTDYEGLAKKAGLPDRTKRYLDFKVAAVKTKIVDELDEATGWKDQAEKAVQGWSGFLIDHKTGWELWPAVRIATRLQIELGKFEEAARTWKKIIDCKDMPPDAKLEAGIQEIDLNFRAKQYPTVASSAAELGKTATGERKERLAIYEAAAADANGGKLLEAVDKVKALMEKTKNPHVHATGYTVMGELYLAAGKTRDAMWMFLWVETVTNQDRDEVLKAMVRLYGIFGAQNDDDQKKKYADKIKQFRANY